MTHPVAEGSQTGVRSVVTKFEVMLREVSVDLLAGGAQERADDRELHAIASTRRNLPDAAQPGRSRAAKEIEQKCFDQIVGMMA